MKQRPQGNIGNHAFRSDTLIFCESKLEAIQRISPQLFHLIASITNEDHSFL